MPEAIPQDMFTKQLFAILDETFETHYGIFLDKGTSLFDTLETISAAEASIPVGDACASLAAQVAHITFYIGVLERYMLHHETGKVDWDEIWRTVQEVTPDEWADLKHTLKEAYQRLRVTLRDSNNWDDENFIGGAMAIVVHTAYHLGEIRQAFCILK